MKATVMTPEYAFIRVPIVGVVSESLFAQAEEAAKGKCPSACSRDFGSRCKLRDGMQLVLY
jgi:hypothetical protein